MSRPRSIALLLILFTLLVYSPVIRHAFLYYDDELYVTDNFTVQKGLTWEGIKWAFTTFYASNWHPLTWLSHMTDCEIFGLNAGAHHFVNAFFHAANTALLFVVLWRLTAQIRPAAVIAALFAWHPLHVETVAWVAERKDVLSVFFALLALLHYSNFVQKKCRAGYWWALFFFALSLSAKPMLVTLPFVLWLLDFWPLQRFLPGTFQWRVIWEKMPFLTLTAISCMLTYLAQRAGNAVATLDMRPLSYRAENAITSVGRYLLKIFWPVDLAVEYPMVPVSMSALVMSFAILVFISAVAFNLRNRRPYMVTGWLWFLGTLIPVIGLVQVGHTSMADRYTYFPSIGLFMALVFGLYAWCSDSTRRMKFLTRIEFLVLIACLLMTVRQLNYWRNTETLFRHALTATKNNGAAHLVVAITCVNEGRFDEALPEYRETLRLSPEIPGLRLAIGNMLDKLGQSDAALAEYRSALRQEAPSADLHNAIGIVLAKQGEITNAIIEFNKAEQLDAHYAQPHIELAKIYFQDGQDTAAANELLAAFRAEQNNFHVLTAIARFAAANAKAAARDPQTALQMTRRAADLSANQQPEVFDVMGMAYAAMEDFTNAVACAQNALELAPSANVRDVSAFRQRLEQYQNHQPWFESFRATNAPMPAAVK